MDLSNFQPKKHPQKSSSVLSDLPLFIGFLIIGILGRTILVSYQVQPFPNFEIITVLTFLAMLFIRPYLAFIVPLFSMIGSDLLIGNPILSGHQVNNIVLFTYTGFLIISLLSASLRNHSSNVINRLSVKTMGYTAGIGIGFTLLYDIWTNAGWWYLIYPHTPATLFSVFAAGIPFMIYHILSGALTFTLIALPIILIVKKKDSLSDPLRIPTVQKIPLVAIALILIAVSLI